MSCAQRLVSFAKPTDGADGFRGKFVEIISFPTDITMAKKMAGTTGSKSCPTPVAEAWSGVLLELRRS
jgi:hypothetical protein